MTQDHLEQLLSYIEFCYPESFEEIRQHDLINKNLFSPFKIELPNSLKEQVSEFVSEIYRIKESPEYQSTLDLPENFSDWPRNKSILTCFDFHYTKEQGLKLIEINTNASLYLPIILQRCAQANLCEAPQFEHLFASFQTAFNLTKGDPISIFDEDPQSEGLYFEFLIFKEWLTQKGYPTNIVSLKNFSEKSNTNVYNRYTDFYLERPQSQAAKEAYFNKEKTFSPNPREYFLMADKQRLMALRNQLEISAPEMAQIIPETLLFSDFADKDEIWKNRKNYFFKPSTGFGSKGAFAGKSISRKAFEALYSPDFIAQEYCPAGKKSFQWEDESVEMKFDLRFFTFNGEIQNYGARIYQGQTTNMRTPLGGLTPIIFR